jgi:hypothetical protein
MVKKTARGSLAQPGSTLPMVSINQFDPIGAGSTPDVVVLPPQAVQYGPGAAVRLRSRCRDKKRLNNAE